MYSIKRNIRTKMLSIWSKFCLNQEATTHGKSMTTCHSFQKQRISTKKYLKRHTKIKTIEEFSKAYFHARNQKGTEATDGMMHLLWSGHLSSRILSKQLGVINHWLRWQIDKKCPLIIFFNMNPLDAYFINKLHNPGKLTFDNASFCGKRAAVHRLRRPINFDW